MIVFLVLLFIIGLFFGSFLNVVSDRLPKNKSFLVNRSFCPNCKHTLSFLDLIPVMSYILLKGKCRYCKKKIDFWYPLSEIITGIIFALTYVIFSVSFSPMHFLFVLIISSLLIIVFLTDIKYGVILDEITGSAIFLTLIYMLLFLRQDLVNHFLAAMGASFFFLAIIILTKGKGMGLGDVKFSFFMGLLLGIPGIVVSLYIAFLTGAFVAIILILWRKKRFFKDTISFGPFLVLGTTITFFWGNIISPLFLKLLGL